MSGILERVLEGDVFFGGGGGGGRDGDVFGGEDGRCGGGYGGLGGRGTVEGIFEDAFLVVSWRL